jgi:putative spermidine/putrescine transport system substrate-binding protein
MVNLATKVAALILVLAFGLGCSELARAQDVVRITSWGGTSQEAEHKAWYQPYAQSSHVKVVEDVWNGELGKVRAMVGAHDVTWDVINGDYEHAITGCDEGILEKIDLNELGGPARFLPGTTHPCGAPTHIFSVIFAYDQDRIPAAWGKARPETIADMFDTTKFPGKRTLRKDPKWMFEAVLMADGVLPEEVYTVLGAKGGIDRVLRKLKAIRDDVIWWTAGSQPPQLLADREVAIAEMYAARLYGARVNDKKHFVPIWDGQVYAANSWIIPKGANKKAAMDFLKYVTQPEVVARITQSSNYGLSIVGTAQYVPDAVKPYIPTAPENLTRALASGETWWADHYEEFNERFQRWLAE